MQILHKYLQKSQHKGFISASFDSIVYDSAKVYAYFYRGSKYFWNEIKFPNELKSVCSFEKLENKPVNFSVFQLYVQQVSNYYTYNGFPFVSVVYDSLKISENKISTNIIIDKGRYVIFDSIFFDDKKVNVSKKFLSNYLDFRKQEPFNDEVVKSISDKIEQLSFLENVSEPEVEFHQKTVDLYLFIRTKKLSQFAGILAFTNVDDKYALHGSANVKFVNILGRADEISLVWKKTKKKSQNMDFNFSIPYFFNTKIGIANSLILNKFDTSYVDFYNKFTVSYYFKGMNNAGAFYSYSRSIVLDTNSAFANFLISSYGLNINFLKLDNHFSPRKGYKLNVSVDLGEKNNYDSTVNRMSFTNDFSLYFSVYNNIVFHFRNYLFYFKSKNVYENELFKFGGSNLMRGFDEQALSGNFANISTIETRYMLDKMSSVFVFLDYSILKHLTVTSDYWQHQISSGVGINLRTKTGLLSLTYALGKQDKQNLILKNSKIHFGYKTFF